MGQLIVRNLDDDLVRRLKIRAAERGHSAEEEHREILRDALAPAAQTSLRDDLMAIPDVGDDADFERNRDAGRTIDW